MNLGALTTCQSCGSTVSIRVVNVLIYTMCRGIELGEGGDKFEVEIREFGDREDMGWFSVSLSLQLLHSQIMISHT